MSGRNVGAALEHRRLQEEGRTGLARLVGIQIRLNPRTIR